MYDIHSVYLVDFRKGYGGELSGKHYAIVITSIKKSDNTLVVVPLTSKKEGKKYRNGFTIDCKKYQVDPTHDKAFAMVDKIREVSRHRIYGDKIYDLDKNDVNILNEKIKSVLAKAYNKEVESVASEEQGNQ